MARRVVTVVQSTKGINNNNHIPRNQPNSYGYAQVRSSASTVSQNRPSSQNRPVRNAPPAPSNPAPIVPRGQQNPANRAMAPSSNLQKHPSMRSSRAPPPPSTQPPANQPVLRPPSSQVGGFRLPNPGAFRLPNPVPSEHANSTKPFK